MTLEEKTEKELEWLDFLPGSGMFNFWDRIPRIQVKNTQSFYLKAILLTTYQLATTGSLVAYIFNQFQK